MDGSGEGRRQAGGISRQVHLRRDAVRGLPSALRRVAAAAAIAAAGIAAAPRQVMPDHAANGSSAAAVSQLQRLAPKHAFIDQVCAIARHRTDGLLHGVSLVFRPRRPCPTATVSPPLRRNLGTPCFFDCYRVRGLVVCLVIPLLQRFVGTPPRASPMATGHEDLYVIYLRCDSLTTQPESSERPVMVCASYSEARRVQRMLQRADQQCVIRFQGNTGGGD